MSARQPIFNDLPPVVLVLIAAICAVSAGILLAPAGVSDWLLGATAVASNLGHVPGPPLPQPLGPVAPYVLHVFAHGGWAHLAMNMGLMLAFGVGVARWLGEHARGVGAFLALFFVSAAAGAGAEILVSGGQPVLLVGASSGASGLIAAGVYLYVGRRAGVLPAPFSRAYAVGLAPWVALNVAGAVVTQLLGAGVLAGGPIAWTAHIGGLAAGAALFPLLTRWTRPRLDALRPSAADDNQTPEL